MGVDKVILDACCGGRMFWFNNMNPRAVFMDVRDEEVELSDGRMFRVSPDVVGDFTNMPFADGSFKLVVFDPPHLHKGGNITSNMAKKYGKLPKDWRQTMRLAFSECFRVLEDYGVLVFKWSEVETRLKQVMECCPVSPLFGTKTSKNTAWVVYMKLPEDAHLWSQKVHVNDTLQKVKK